MQKLVIEGGRPLTGSVDISGAKNAALPILASCLLSDEECVLEGVPDLRDVDVMFDLLRQLGLEVERDDEGRVHTRVVDAAQIMAPYEIVKKMRASVCLLGPLLGKRGTAIVSMPGGCVIGTRPIDLHLKGLKALGTTIGVEGGYVHATAERLQGAEIYLGGSRGSTVLGTANVLMAAVLSKGRTVIECAAMEPEIVDLVDFLNSRGASIQGGGTSRLEIEGVERIGGGQHRIIPDRIETATFMAAAAITQGDVTLRGTAPEHMTAVLETFAGMGVGVEVMRHETPASGGRTLADIRVSVAERARCIDVTTMPYPGFPTDAQAQVMALMSVSEGSGTVTERIYPDRFMHVAELARMGADIRREGDTAHVRGVAELSGAPVMASDLWASVALVLAGLVARGQTIVDRIYHIDRGYERIEERLGALGASVERIGVDSAEPEA